MALTIIMINILISLLCIYIFIWLPELLSNRSRGSKILQALSNTNQIILWHLEGNQQRDEVREFAATSKGLDYDDDMQMWSVCDALHDLWPRN